MRPSRKPVATSSGVRFVTSSARGFSSAIAELHWQTSRVLTRNAASRTCLLISPEGLNCDLSSHLDDTPGRNLEIVGRIIGRAGKTDKQAILPPRHSGSSRGFQRAPRQEK